MPREKEPIIARLTRGEKEREFSRPSAAKEIYPFMPLPPLRSLTLTLFSPRSLGKKNLIAWDDGGRTVQLPIRHATIHTHASAGGGRPPRLKQPKKAVTVR